LAGVVREHRARFHLKEKFELAFGADCGGRGAARRGGRPYERGGRIG